VREIAKALGIAAADSEGYEADDVIGTLAQRAQKSEIQVEIFTGDKDALQLIDKYVSVVAPQKGISETETFDEKKVKDKYGITPGQIADWKALKGDSSDNIPGIPGIGEKTATALLQTFHNLDHLLKNVDKVENQKLKEKIQNNLESAVLSKKLATIVTDVPLKIDLSDCQRQPLDWEKIIPLFKKFEFKSLIKKYAAEELPSSQPGLWSSVETTKKTIQKIDAKHRVINNPTDLKKLLNEIKKADCLVIDTETTAVDPFSAKLVGISLCFSPEKAYYIPLSHKTGKQLDKQETLEALRPILENKNIKKLGHNIKYDMEILSNYGITLDGIAGDSMLAAYVLDPTGGSKSLKFLVPAHLGQEMQNFDEVLGKEHKTFEDVDINLAANYAGDDALYTFQLNKILEQKLEEQNLLDLYQKLEVPLIMVLTQMEIFGTYVNCAKLKKLSQKLQADLKALEQEILILAGEEFNINSTKQLQQILFHKLKLPVIKRTKTGISTDSEVLEELAPKFEIAQKLLNYRTIAKLLSTYVDALPELVNEKTGRIHTSFNQTITATGRLSSSNPNLQNIPARGPYAQVIRAAFVPQKKGWVVLAADYSQIELRILAHLSGDPELIKAFQDGKDIHAATAAAVNNVPLEKVTTAMRSAAKAINFGIIYGMSDFGLSKQLGIKRQEAKNFIDRYFAKYAKVKEFIDKTIADAREKGYVETMLGRRRALLDINSPNPNLRGFAERTAINTPVQGTAADMIKVAMINLHKKLAKFKAKMILQVHDELVLELPKSEVAEVKKMVEREMQNAIQLNVPIKIDVGIGPSWAEAK
jgi:DNA polymerase-1